MFRKLTNVTCGLRYNCSKFS